MVQVHRCQFQRLLPSAVTGLSVDPTATRCAVARQNGNIEVWRSGRQWWCEQQFPGFGENSVRCLAWWCPNGHEKGQRRRLLSSGLHGQIIYWDFEKLSPKLRVSSCGGAVWALAVSNSQEYLAAACEDGTVRIFELDAEMEDLVYKKSLNHTDRVLSICWSHDDKTLVCGTAKSRIVSWDMKSFSERNRITIEQEGDAPTLVWGVALLRSGVIISGDSLGNTSFWEEENGTLLQSFRAHKADVLTVAAKRLPDGSDCVISSGVDSKVVKFDYIERQERWVASKWHRIHTHDVAALAIVSAKHFPPMLLSGGMDTKLVLCDPVSFRVKDTISSLAGKQRVRLATRTKQSNNEHLLLVQHDKMVRLWSFGCSDTNGAAPKKYYSPLADINIASEGNLTASALSSNGLWMAAGSSDKTRLWNITNGPDVVPKRTKAFCLRKRGTCGLAFTPDGAHLISATLEPSLVVVDTNKNACCSSVSLHSRATHMVVNATGKLMAVRTLGNSVTVYQLPSLKVFYSIPGPCRAVVTRLEFHPTQPEDLYIMYISNEWDVFDVRKKTVKSRIVAAVQPSKTKDVIQGLSFDATRPNSPLRFSSSGVASVDLAELSVPTVGSKRRNSSMVARPKKKSRHGTPAKRSDSITDSIAMMSPSRRVTPRKVTPLTKSHRGDDVILLAQYTGPNQVVIVTNSWDKVVHSLPNPLYRKLYGT